MIIKLIIYIILSVGGLILFKSGGDANSLALSIDKLSINFSILSLIGIFCYGCSFLLWLTIIKDSDLSYIFPIANGLVTIATILGGIIIFGEKLNYMQCIGIICIIVGVGIVNMFK